MMLREGLFFYAGILVGVAGAIFVLWIDSKPRYRQ
jgi:hypothetical protein